METFAAGYSAFRPGDEVTLSKFHRRLEGTPHYDSGFRKGRGNCSVAMVKRRRRQSSWRVTEWVDLHPIAKAAVGTSQDHIFYKAH